MKLFDKVKNFFYDEEEIEEEDEKEVPIKIHNKREKQEDNISERELFRSERTFNFPMDIDEEKEEVTVKSIKEENVQINNTVDTNSYKSTKQSYENNYSRLRTYTKPVETKEQKKFKPTPVISPIYGVLDKNYKKEDIAIDATREFNVQKKLDYDTVRRKAYGNMYNNESVKDEESKGIFFNLDEEKSDEFNTDDDVKIIYNDVSFDDNEEENITPTVQINSETNNTDDDILSETKEQDLFNLIDNMYNSDETDEDEGDE